MAQAGDSHDWGVPPKDTDQAVKASLHDSHLKIWASMRMRRVKQGTARRRMSLFRAGLMPWVLMRQSVDRAPLVTDEKAKLAAVKSQVTDAGAGTLVLPTMLTY